jgi:hypothetical protein
MRRLSRDGAGSRSARSATDVQSMSEPSVDSARFRDNFCAVADAARWTSSVLSVLRRSSPEVL